MSNFNAASSVQSASQSSSSTSVRPSPDGRWHVVPGRRIEIQPCREGYAYRLGASKKLHLARRTDMTSPLYDHVRALDLMARGRVLYDAREEDRLIRKIKAITDAAQDPKPAQYAPWPDAPAPSNGAPANGTPASGAANGEAPAATSSAGEQPSGEQSSCEQSSNEQPTYEHDLRAVGPEEEPIVARFIAVKREIEALKSELKQLKPTVTDLVMEQPDDMEATFDGVKLRVYFRKTYDYSDAVDEIKAKLKATRSYERAHGIASVRKEQAVLRVTL